MTPQERAAAIVDKVKSELTPIWLGGRQRMLLEQEIAEAIIATRRAALLEVRDYALACMKERQTQAFELAKVVINDPRAVWLGCKASEAERIAEWIDKLAQEGA